MAWTNRIVATLDEYKNKEGVLRHRWEVTRPENEEGKHLAEGLQKTGYYMKDGELKRGYPQPLTKYEMNWIRNNWARIIEALDPPPGATSVKPSVTAGPETGGKEKPIL